MKFWRRVRSALRNWWECRTKRCTYFTHYQVYGPCELSHDGWHNAERQGEAHIRNCQRDWAESGPCPVCLNWERRLRA